MFMIRSALEKTLALKYIFFCITPVSNTKLMYEFDIGQSLTSHVQEEGWNQKLKKK